MRPPLTDTLCTHCGLCCDGTLFADVELAGRAEATRLEAMGLRIEEDEAAGELLLQPCTALRGTRCSVYAHRPGCCRTFECALLQDAGSGRVTVEAAQAHIVAALTLTRRAKTLLAELGESAAPLPLGERAAEALASASPAVAATTRRRGELRATMRALERLIRTTFLRRSAT